MVLLHIAGALLLLRCTQATDTYDYIIAGAGSAGLVVANRLSAQPYGFTVAVIEPGGDERGNKNVSNIPDWNSFLNSHVNWLYKGTPQPELNGRVMTLAAGNGIGGSSLINGMTYIRGDRAEVDAWKALGNDGWSWDALFPHYKSSTNFTPPSTDQVEASGATFDAANYDSDGPLKVGFPRGLATGSLYGLRRDTFKKIGVPEVHDFNGGSVRGFGVPAMTIDVAANVREDAGRAYYWPVSTRPNLKVIKGTVRRVIWRDDDAKDGAFLAGGVEYLDEHNVVSCINAKTEVILSAGSYRSPGILELSGVGHPSILEKLGIATKINLPGVGENLHDQPLVSEICKINVSDVSGMVETAAFISAQDLFGTDSATLEAAVKANITSWAAAASQRTGGAIPASAYQTIFEVQHDMMFNKDVTIAEIFGWGSNSTIGSTTWTLLPFSRGCVHASSADVSAINKPYIDNAFFQIDFDMQTMLAQLKLMWKFWKTEPMSSINPVSFTPPTPYPANDDDWIKWIRQETTPNNHPIGSASMMSRDLGGVVDSQFRVYGTSNVRVVDASVIPLQISGHLTSTLYALADKAADFILGVE